MAAMLQQKRKKWCCIGCVFLMVMIVAIIAIVLNRVWIYDWYRGLNYKPDAEMASIRDRLELTEKGVFLFSAAWPELDNADDFNTNCKHAKTEVAMLGCYTDGNIYVYNIDSEELDGIREVTVAHELLHAVWGRMSDDEKTKLQPTLKQVYQDNIEVLEEDLAIYDETERMEEIFVRAGTEIRSLPSTLEKIYSEIFISQDAIVDYYDGYISVFKELKKEMESLKENIDTIGARIENMTDEYKRLLDQLEADIVSFNSCAEVAGCFKNESDFYGKRNELVARQDELNALYDEINESIDDYNDKIEKYNADVTESHKMQDMINSNKKIDF